MPRRSSRRSPAASTPTASRQSYTPGAYSDGSYATQESSSPSTYTDAPTEIVTPAGHAADAPTEIVAPRCRDPGRRLDAAADLRAGTRSAASARQPPPRPASSACWPPSRLRHPLSRRRAGSARHRRRGLPARTWARGPRRAVVVVLGAVVVFYLAFWLLGAIISAAAGRTGSSSACSWASPRTADTCSASSSRLRSGS